MPVYHINEGVIEVPDEWKDRTVNVFLTSDERPSDFGLIVTRDELQNGEDHQAYVQRQLEQLSQNLNAFQIINQHTTSVGYLPASEAEFTWQSETNVMMQRQIYLFLDRKVLVFTATSNGEFSEHHDWLLNGILSSFQYRG